MLEKARASLQEKSVKGSSVNGAGTDGRSQRLC